MNIKWKNVAVMLLVIGGGIGVSVAAVRSSSKTKISSEATMSDSSMASMQSDTSSCEMCSSGKSSPCTDGGCPQSESMMNMTADKAMSKGVEMSMGGEMSMGDSSGAVKSGEKMSEVNMANTLSQSMSDKSMTPSMGSSKISTGEQMAVVPKM